MKAILNGITIAQSDDTLTIEGNHYFPLESVDPTVLRARRMKSPCPWKGVASYFDVEVQGVRARQAAWTYRHTYPWIRKIKGSIAFWNGIEVLPD